MVSTDGSFRTRATSLLQSASPFRSGSVSLDARGPHPLSQSTLPLDPSSASEKSQLDGSPVRDTSVSSNGKTLVSSSGDVVAENIDAQRHVRVLPPWICGPEDLVDEEDGASRLLPRAPPEAQVAHHNSSPTPKSKRPDPGHLWDADRESTPPTVRYHLLEIGSRWRAFADASVAPLLASEDGRRVTEDWLLEHGPDYSQPWKPAADPDLEKDGGRISTQRRVWWKRLQHTALRNPIMPLVLRMIVFTFSLIALALGAKVYEQFQDVTSATGHVASPILAIVVDAIALLYIIYITHDEYTGKPLGLRSARAKMRLLFLDLFFIVFGSANLSLAFQAVTDSGENPIFPPGERRDKVLRQQAALASVLLVALIAWMMTFAISVLRVVERVVQK